MIRLYAIYWNDNNKWVTRVQKQINPNLKIGGVLLTLVDKRTNLSKDVRDTLIDNYRQYVRIYGAEIPKAINTEKSDSNIQREEILPSKKSICI